MGTPHSALDGRSNLGGELKADALPRSITDSTERLEPVHVT